MKKVKALSLWQPWASAIALGLKRIETRSWPTKYRGPLLIHAGKSQKGDDLVHPVWLEDCMRVMPPFRTLPFGALVAVCDLVDCVQVKPGTLADLWKGEQLGKSEQALGNFSVGRYCWVLGNIRALPKPIPYKGRQGLFEVPSEVYA